MLKVKVDGLAIEIGDWDREKRSKKSREKVVEEGEWIILVFDFVVQWRWD